MKTPEILEHLKSRIVEGEFKPGEKLPNRPELLREYSVSVSAFQKCINQLSEWNFLESKGMKGVCVTPNPPHLCRFAVLLPIKADKILEETDSLIVAFRQVVEEWTGEHPEFSFQYYRVGPTAAPEMDEWERFCSDAHRGLLAGAVNLMTAPPLELQRRLEDFPNVVVSLKREDMPHNSPDIEFDLVEMFRKQLAHLMASGCKNIAVLLNDNMSIAKILSIMNLAEQSGVNCPRRRILGMNMDRTRALFYDNLLELLFAPGGEPVPDGLIVQNENFLPVVMNTFSRLGIVPGRQMKIVSHANMPIVRPRVAGVDYTFFPIREVLGESMKLLARWKNGTLENRTVNILISPSDDIVN